MPVGSWRSEPAITQGRIAALEAYFRAKVLSGDHFGCAHAEVCKGSHRCGPFYEGQLPHVGHHFDLMLDSRPMRIVVVGQEYGHNPIHVSLEERRRMIVEGSGQQRRFSAEGQFRARNPHMRGTTSLLRLVFGLGLGTDHASEFLPLQDGATHIFDAFALVNFLLCSALAPGSPAPSRSFSEKTLRGGKSGRSTTTMQENCFEHFLQTIEILDPTLVVTQGKSVRSWIGRRLDVSPLGGPTVERCCIRGRWVPLVSLSHPSARFPHNWGANEYTPYLLNTVMPAVQTARQH